MHSFELFSHSAFTRFLAVAHEMAPQSSGRLSPWAGTCVVLFVAFIVARIGQGLLKSASNVDAARTIRAGRRYVLATVLVTGLYFVWATEFHHFIYAFAALLASVVLVAKDVLACVLGDFVKMYNRLCPVGAIVEIEGVRGEVVDSGLFTTTLQLIQNDYFHSARVIQIPNSVFLTKSIIQESKTGKFSVIFVRIPLPLSSDIGASALRLQKILETVTAPYQAEAEALLGDIHSLQLLDFPSVSPRVLIEPASSEEVRLVGRFAAPTQHKGSVEQDVLRHFFESRNP